ncbi:MAG: SusC/RagA family TonB-linked outer membrane protein [Bacteroidales bacterium]|nr:SusC/RagA family TonB-linked outer membrane protein [Bacteroidales bacterium]
MKRIITAVAIVLASISGHLLSAQGGYQVRGVIVDATGPVVGATVLEKGTTNGVSTGLDGEWTLSVQGAGAVIEVSCIGYASQEFRASAVPARIVLSEDSEFLDDVVVIGYGTVKKSDLTGSVATVRADEINKGVITTPADLLRGKSAGLVVTSGSGMPGSGATIRIRGGSSINDDANTPMIVIDGLPVSNGDIDGMSDPLSSINPGDIESFTVLKDASATAIYGSRASNGVIVITTKKGSASGSAVPHVSVDFTASVNTIAKYNDLLDADGIISLIRTFYGMGSTAEANLGLTGSDGVQTLYNTDWQKQIYQAAPTYDGNISLSGKAGFLPYRVSGGFTSQEGTLKGSKMNRGTLSVNLSPSFFDKHLTVNLNGKGTIARNWYANQDAISAANHYDPTKPVYNDIPGANLNGYTTWYDRSGNINTMATMNPVALLAAKDDNATTRRFIGNAQFDYKLHGFEDLRLNLNLGLDWARSEGITDIAQGSEASYHNTNQSGGGSHKDFDYTRRNTTLEFYADYNKILDGKHNIDIMGGYSWQRFYNANSSTETRISDGSLLNFEEGKGELFLISFFGRANYGYLDKYLFTATLRADGTSRFQNHKWGIFPSVAFAWNARKEEFITFPEDLSTLKVRLSWGETGQQDVGDYYDTFATFYNNQLGSYYYFNGRLIQPISALGYSADLRWETTATYNAGIDLGFWNDRLTASLDVYKRDTRDILNYIPVPALSNLTNYLNTNIGSMTNKGVELDVNAILIDKRDMSWTAGINMAYNHNRITKLTASEENATGVETGGIAGGTGNNVQMHQVGHAMRSFYVYQQVYDTDGKPVSGAYVDRNDDGVIDADDKYFFHKPDADVTLGFNTSFTYGNWTAALSGHASIGNYVYYNAASDNEMLADLWTNSFISNRMASARESMFTQAQFLSDYYVRNGSFLKLDNFTLGYTFPTLFKMGAYRAASLNVFGTVQNICTLTGYKGIDPEVYGGIDGALYPRPRTYVLGLKFNF